MASALYMPPAGLLPGTSVGSMGSTITPEQAQMLVPQNHHGTSHLEGSMISDPTVNPHTNHSTYHPVAPSSDRNTTASAQTDRPPKPELSLNDELSLVGPQVQQLIHQLAQNREDLNKEVARLTAASRQEQSDLFHQHQARLREVEEEKTALHTEYVTILTKNENEQRELSAAIQQYQEELARHDLQLKADQKTITSLQEELERGSQHLSEQETFKDFLQAQVSDLSAVIEDLKSQVARFSAPSELNEPVQTPQGMFFPGDYLKKHPEIAAQLTGIVCGEFDPTTSRFTPASTEGPLAGVGEGITSTGAQRLLQDQTRDRRDTHWDAAPVAGRGLGWFESSSHPSALSANWTAPGCSMAGDLSVSHSFAKPSDPGRFNPYASAAPTFAPSAFPAYTHATTGAHGPYGSYRPSYAPFNPQNSYGSMTNTYLYDMGTNGFQQQHHAGYLPHGPRPYVNAFEQMHGPPVQLPYSQRSHFGWAPYQGY